MPGERTLYRKIQVVLNYAKEGKHTDKTTLIDYIIGRKPTNFIYYYRDKSTDEIIYGYSEKSLERTIQICHDLKLLSGEALALTRTGVSASDPRRFMTIIGRRTSEFLESKGISLNSIGRAIKKILQASNPQPPTAEAIWKQLEEEQEILEFSTFARFLNLLGQSQRLLMTQRRIYLPASR